MPLSGIVLCCSRHVQSQGFSNWQCSGSVHVSITCRALQSADVPLAGCSNAAHQHRPAITASGILAGHQDAVVTFTPPPVQRLNRS
jgi:hypothetical protein